MSKNVLIVDDENYIRFLLGELKILSLPALKYVWRRTDKLV